MLVNKSHRQVPHFIISYWNQQYGQAIYGQYITCNNKGDT